jgi:glycosyltransferase involved in cell wall biosynthesis
VEGGERSRPARRRPRLVHLTTVDLSLSALLLPQLVAFQDAGYEVIGVSAAGPWVDQIERAGIRHVPLEHSTRASSPRDDLLVMAEFWRVCRRLRPDIVHTHTPKPGVYGRILARLAGVPAVVNTVHGLYALPEDPLPKRAVVYALERLAATFSHAELLQNEEDLPVLRQLRIPDSRLEVLGNGIDLKRFDPAAWPADERERVRAELGVDDDAVVVGAVGRLVVEKGYRELFAAFAALGDLHDRMRLVVVGPSEPDKGDAIGAAELEMAEDRGVRFLGWRDDIDRLYLGMDAYVLPSYREGFPRGAMEAAAMGLPVVASDVRGCRQVVDDGVTGRLVPVRDAVSLAAALRELVVDAGLRRAFGEAARQRALSRFDDRRQVEITLATYRRLGVPPEPGRP